MASILGFEIKNMVKFRGREGQGCQGEIYYNGEKVGWYNDSADGGMAEIDFWQNDVKCRDDNQALFDKAVKDYFAAYPLTGALKDMEPNGELFMHALVELTEFEEKYKLYSMTGRQFFVVYENESGTEVSFISSSDPFVFDRLKRDKAAFNVKLYKSLEDFNIK